MTKLKHLLLLIFCIGLYNCDTESADSEEETVDNTLIKRIVYNEGTDNEYTEVFSYTDGNNLASVDDGLGFKNEYTYAGKFLVKDNLSINGELAASVDLEYNIDENIASYTETFFEPSGLSDRSFKSTFTYNDNGTLTNEIFVSYSNADFELLSTETFNYDGTNISKIDTVEEDYAVTMTYDDKNSIFKNIHAIEILNILSENEFGSLIYGNTNNMISYIQSGINGSGLYTDTYDYTYNEKNYPISCIYRSTYDDEPEEIETLNFYYE